MLCVILLQLNSAINTLSLGQRVNVADSLLQTASVAYSLLYFVIFTIL